jgi:hypothetical protein
MEPPFGFGAFRWDSWMDGKVHLLSYEDAEDVLKFRHYAVTRIKQLSRREPKWLAWSQVDRRASGHKDDGRHWFTIQVFDTQEERMTATSRMNEDWD